MPLSVGDKFGHYEVLAAIGANAYTKSWEPSDKPSMTVILTFEDAGAGKTEVHCLCPCNGRREALTFRGRHAINT